MKITKKRRIRGFLSLELYLTLFVFTVVLQLSYCFIKQYKYGYIYVLNKNKMLVLKKYLCNYIKENFSIPELMDNQLSIVNKKSQYNFFNKKKDILSLLPTSYQFNYNNKPFKIYLGNIDNNEILYIVDETYDIKVVIYGHDIDIYNKETLREISTNNEKTTVLFYNKDL